jgi:hypothetical protein
MEEQLFWDTWVYLATPSLGLITRILDRIYTSRINTFMKKLFLINLFYLSFSFLFQRWKNILSLTEETKSFFYSNNLYNLHDLKSKQTCNLR